MSGSGNGAGLRRPFSCVGPAIGDDLAAAIEEEIASWAPARCTSVPAHQRGTHPKAFMAAFSASPGWRRSAAPFSDTEDRLSPQLLGVHIRAIDPTRHRFWGKL